MVPSLQNYVQLCKKQEKKLFMQNRCLYRNSLLHEAYSCRTNAFIEFHYDMKKDTTNEESIDSKFAVKTPERRQLMSLWCFNC